MLTRFRPRYANVTSTLALFVALSGGAYAAASLPARSVGPAQLKKDAVVRAKIKSNAVNGSKVAGNSLSGADIDESTLAKVPAAALADGAGHANSAAALDKITYKSATGSAPAGSVGSATAGCDAGQHVIGGGVKADDPANLIAVDSYPDAGGTVWTARIWNSGPAPSTFTVYAICTTAAAVG
jgi:hypothetical protein